MTDFGLPITAAEMTAGVSTVLDRFNAYPTEYDTTVTNSAELFNVNNMAFYVPYVQFILDATLNTLSQTTVQQKLPTEVQERTLVAMVAAQSIASTVVNNDIFDRFFNDRRQMYTNTIIVNRTPAQLFNEHHLASLSMAPLFDAQVTAGGAFNYIKHTNPTANPTETIVKSTGLLAVSGIKKDVTSKVADVLGIPYANISNFTTTTDGKINFTNDIHDYFRQFDIKGRGCPAGKMNMPTYEGSNSTILKSYWGKIVRYLLPPYATTEDTVDILQG